MKTFQKDTGQVVLLLVLVTVVGLTIGLSLISRTITDIRMSSQIEESSRAFSAAEAGVETALKGIEVGGPTTGSVTLPGASGSYNIAIMGNSSAVYTLPTTSANKTQTVWLAEHAADGSLDKSYTTIYPSTSSFDICWGSNQYVSNFPPALVATLWYFDRTGSMYKIAKAAFDPNNALRVNNFYDVADQAGGYCNGNFQYMVTMSAADPFGVTSANFVLVALRLQAVYADTAFAFAPAVGATLPSQGKIVSSKGQSSTTDIVRKIQVSEGYQTIPELFDYTLFGENIL